MKRIKLYVEGATDARIVEKLLRAAGLPLDKVEIVPLRGKKDVLDKARKAITQDENEVVAVLVDSDETFVPDALEEVRRDLGDKQIEVFFAIPEIEAWLFADDVLAQKFARNESAKKALQSIASPEDILAPKEFANYIFGGIQRLIHSEEEINVSRAASRSPSLKYFLTRMAELLEVGDLFLQDAISYNLNLQLISNLLKETLNADTILYRTADGSQYTAQEMERSIAEGLPVGREYASDLLRVARDFLKRKANRA
ncbi:MAG: DUF4276 family protein [Saprospiraceae bacterium]